ncbi:MAG: SMC-Scp complex subunit ScpB [Firmicutes bacterium]|nr:SMC-Scp complex subunit ScpB [Bacillota bacterium]
MKLENLIEGILFLAGEGISITELLEKLSVSESELEKTLERMEKKYSGNSGIHIIRYNEKVQFTSNPEYGENIALVLNPIRERELSQSMLETLAIIAYKQPLTRLDIEEVRGVSSDYAISNLLKHNLITIVGRKNTLGKPALFGTTDLFLKRFGLVSVDQLPEFATTLERLKQIQSSETLEAELLQEKEFIEID